MINAKQFQKIMIDYDEKRRQKHFELEQRKEKIYAEIPSIEEIDDQLASIGCSISKQILQHPEDSETLIQRLQKKQQSLLEEKKDLLLQQGYAPEDLMLQYQCSKCKDTGYIESQPCSCLKQKLIHTAYFQSNLKSILEIENFNNFDFSFYSSTINTETGMSPLENIRLVYEQCLRFVEEFSSKDQNLILYGNTGLGKTFLCHCIAKELLDSGYTVLYITAFQLFQIFENYKFQKKQEDKLITSLEFIFEADLLIIDDLGTEFDTALTGVELFNCLNTRLLNNRATIISTNLSPSEWKQRYSDRIVSRIFGNYKALKLFGKDIRVQKKYIR